MADASTSDSDRGCESFDSSADTEIERRFPQTDVFGVAHATIYPRPGESGEPIDSVVMVRNLSSLGFGITLDDPLLPGQRVELEMEHQRLVGEVAWCRQIQPKIHLVGCFRLDPQTDRQRNA